MTAQTESKAEHVFSVVDGFWPVPDNPHPSAAEAVKAAKEVEALLFECMDDQGLQRGHGFCLLICASKSGKVHPLALLGDPALSITRNALEPIGIVFGILAAEKKAVMHQTRGFGKSERTDRLLSEIHTRIALDIKSGKFLKKVRQN